MSSDLRALRRAHLVLLALAMAGCGSSVTSQPASTPTEAAAASATPEATSETPSPSPSPTVAPSPVEREVGLPVAFTLTTPGDWESDVPIPEGTSLRIGTDRWVVFSGLGPDTPDGWINRLDTDPYQITEPEPVEIGGASGYVVDLTLPQGTQPQLLMGNPLWGWEVTSGRPNRLWIVDVDGETVIIMTDAPVRAFDNWVAEVEDVLLTIEWGE